MGYWYVSPIGNSMETPLTITNSSELYGHIISGNHDKDDIIGVYMIHNYLKQNTLIILTLGRP